ncbi:MAG: protein-glutamate O-methyltransferase CheR [Porticoccaceae bacterium]|nr:protein-glutamate O-methyltransferase CheR [Porticoccaceae bacterium]
MNEHDKEELELDLFIELVKRYFDYNFDDYTRASVKRRIKHLVVKRGVDHICELIPKVLYENDFRRVLLQGISVTVTEMFRDPWVFASIRNELIPTLTILPTINIWHAGCATGEEVYSMAILLQEAGLLQYCHIYATDFNESSLEIAKQGKYPLENIKSYTKNYIAAGGICSFSDYYSVDGRWAILDPHLKEHIHFRQHDLAKDESFGMMNLILCRNVLIYFKKTLQDLVFNLFNASLSTNGFLIIGDKETIDFSSIADDFEAFCPKCKIYRRH